MNPQPGNDGGHCFPIPILPAPAHEDGKNSTACITAPPIGLQRKEGRMLHGMKSAMELTTFLLYSPWYICVLFTDELTPSCDVAPV